MNQTLKSLLIAAFTVVMMAGCSAQSGSDVAGGGNGSGNENGNGDNGNGNGNGNGGNGPGDTVQCAVPVDDLCVMGGDEHGAGLVESLIDSDGPLGPMAQHIEVDALTTSLETMLRNDGNLANLVEGLIAGGQLQDGLMLLLVGEDGEGGLSVIAGDLLSGDETGEGLVGLFGEEGVTGLFQALLVDPADPDCQAPLGTLCLITGNGSQIGFINLLLTHEGALAQVCDCLAQDDLVAILANMLESDGSLADLVEGLLADGQLAAGLQTLLIGDPDAAVPSGLVQALEGFLDGSLVDDLVDFIGGLLGLGWP